MNVSETERSGPMILEALEKHDYRKVRLLIRKLGPADISELFKDLDLSDAVVLFRLVAKTRRANVLAFLTFEQQQAILDRLPDEMVIRLLNELDPVDRTKLLEEVTDELRGRFLQMLEPEEREIATKILSYPEESVGRLMTPEFVSIKGREPCVRAIEDLRWRATKYSERMLQRIFVVDEKGTYRGSVTLAGLMMADPPNLAVEEVMQKDIPGLSVMADESDAVDFFRKYDEPFIPVIDEEDRLVGLVESDDVFDLAEEEATEDIQQFGGHGALEDSYFQTPTFTLVRKRAGWLIVLFFGMLFTTNALEFFHSEIEKWSFLVFFLPLIISSGGNSGSQAASLMIRGLAVKEVDLKDWLRVLRRELIIGISLGLVLGVFGFARALLGENPPVVGLTIAMSLIGIVLFGAICGAMLPFLIKLVRLDPAVSSSPLIASVVDLVGIVIFFKIAMLMLPMGF